MMARGLAASVWSIVFAIAWIRRPRSYPAVGHPSPSVATVVGSHARALVRLAPDDAGAASLGRALLAIPVAALVWPPLVAAVGIGGLAWPVVTARRRRAAHETAVIGELPEAIELTRLALASSGSVVLAVTAVGQALSGPVGAALARVASATDRGTRLADALALEAATVAPHGRGFFRLLAGSERYGVSIASALERLAGEARRQRRRHAEAMARRVPVRMLLPLVGCILPAFVLLTVVPILARTLLSIDVGQ